MGIRLGSSAYFLSRATDKSGHFDGTAMYCGPVAVLAALTGASSRRYHADKPLG